MICKLCHTNYAENISFKTLFRQDFFCPSCRKKYLPHDSLEIIPVTNGWIEYHSLMDFTEVNPQMKKYLFRFMKPFFIEWMKCGFDRLILIIDDDEFNRFELWFPLIRVFSPLYFYSITYYDWSVYPDYLF